VKQALEYLQAFDDLAAALMSSTTKFSLVLAAGAAFGWATQPGALTRQEAQFFAMLLLALASVDVFVGYVLTPWLVRIVDGSRSTS